MKTKNKIISIFMCLCLALLSGCSQDSGGQPDAGTAGTVNTFAAGNTNKEESSSNFAAAEGNAANTSDDVAEVTEAENQPADERFAYYDLLSEEYDKSGKLYRIGPGVVGSYGNDALVINGKAIIIDENFDYSNANNIKVKVYDCETKSDIADFQFDNFADYTSESLFYADVDGGYIYRTPQESYSGTLYKYDIGGNMISQAETAEGEVLDLLFTDGTFITHSGLFDDRKYYLYSEDWKTKTEIPDLQYDAGHGIMEKITEYDVAAKYKNKIYVYAVRSSTYLTKEHEGYYCLNTDTGTWEHVESELQDTPYIEPTDFNSYYLNYSTVGRYFLFEGYSTRSRSPSGIYDMETDTIIANTPMQSYFGQNYKGGKSTLYINDYGQLRRGRYPSDGSEEEVVETILESEKLSYVGGESKIAVNEEYYLLLDKYGAFLRTYEGGEDGEITVMLFEN